MASPFDRDNVMNMSVNGLVEAQRALDAAALAVQPGSQTANMRLTVGQIRRYWAGISPVVTGRYKNGIFDDVVKTANALYGIDATNVIYALPVERRHKVAQRTAEREGPSVAREFGIQISRSISRGA